jgi:tetratricopeptide (TPR) repeat protein
LKIPAHPIEERERHDRLNNCFPSGPARVAADLRSRRDRALALLLTHRGDPLAEVNRVLAEDPHCVSGHCLRAAAIVGADASVARPLLTASLAAIEAACPDADHPARRHADAARAWLDGDSTLAAERYGSIVIDRPQDVLALTTAHALDFRLGRRRMLQDRLAQALPAWNPAMPGYASVLAMYAFGLEENGHYRQAEELARRALAIDPGHPGAIHVIAHVMEMEGRAREGLAFLDKTEDAWIEGTGFSVHLAWHRALFQVEADDPASALETYDVQIAVPRGAEMAALADGSALLWRLQLRNISVGERWRELADRWERQSLAGVRPFFVIHAVIAFAAAGRAAAAARAFAALPRLDPGDASAPLPEEALAAPFCEALLAFAGGDYAACVEWLRPVHGIAHRCGGSLAQCDIIHLTFTEAALRARKPRLACALVAERAAQKPTSRLNARLQARLRTIEPAAA